MQTKPACRDNVFFIMKNKVYEYIEQNASLDGRPCQQGNDPQHREML